MTFFHPNQLPDDVLQKDKQLTDLCTHTHKHAHTSAIMPFWTRWQNL